mmetsp:Transcript_15904/g.45533  ORF Transcript_15904/g.45533 Transcript_15904/m.45533 type:complete len:259 (-) Transcript_15904:868-1644(-)
MKVGNNRSSNPSGLSSILQTGARPAPCSAPEYPPNTHSSTKGMEYLSTNWPPTLPGCGIRYCLIHSNGPKPSPRCALYVDAMNAAMPAMPWIAAARTTRFPKYPRRTPSKSGDVSRSTLFFSSSRMSTDSWNASSIAMQPPCPKFGCIACALSPNSATRPSTHLKIGGRSKMSRRRTSSSGVAIINSVTLSFQHPNSSISRSFFRPGASSPPAGSLLNAYHCIFPPPTSLLTKYCSCPRNTRYPTVSMSAGVKSDIPV